MRSVSTTIYLVLIGALSATQLLFGQAPGGSKHNERLEPPAAIKELYPVNADARKEIEAAIERAAKNHRRVFLVFGADWCYACHVLDAALHAGDAGKIMGESFELVHVDTGEGNRNVDLAKQYKIPLDKGVPAIAILDSDGNLLYSSADAEFESAHRLRKKDLIEFLRKWQRRDSTKD